MYIIGKSLKKLKFSNFFLLASLLVLFISVLLRFTSAYDFQRNRCPRNAEMLGIREI